MRVASFTAAVAVAVLGFGATAGNAAAAHAAWPQHVLFAERIPSSQAVLGSSLFMLVSRTTSPERGPYRLASVDLTTTSTTDGQMFSLPDVATAAGRVWLSGIVARRPRLDDVDPVSRRVVHSLRLPAGVAAYPRVAVVAGPAGSVWIGSNRTLLRLDVTAWRVLAKASVPPGLVATDLATDPQRRHLYVSFANVVRGGIAGAAAIEYDASSGAEIVRAAKKTLADSAAGASLTAVRGGVWASFRTGSLGLTIRLRQRDLSLAPPRFSWPMSASTLADGGSLWTANETGAVACVDPTTGRVGARETVGPGNGLQLLAVDAARRRVLALGSSLAVVALTPPATCWRTANRVPPWVVAADDRTLARVFGGARPIRTTHIAYPRKIATIFTFDRVVVCGACSAPSNASLPRGRVIRVSYDRRSRRITGAYEFCESRGARPPARFCLRQ